MKKVMVLLALAVVPCAVLAASGPENADSADCLARATQWIPPDRDVTLFCNDGSRPVGRIVEFDSARQSLLFQPAGPQESMRALPAGEVLRLEWREPGEPSVGGALIGLLLGGLVGLGFRALTHSGEDTGLMGPSEQTIDSCVSSTVVGAGLGMVAGLLISGSSDHRYVVDCRGNLEFLPPRARDR